MILRKLPSKIILSLLSVCLLVCFCACDKTQSTDVDVDYSISTNSFNIKTIDNDDYLAYEPIYRPSYDEKGELVSYTQVNYKYGLIFYVGAGIDPSLYAYLGNALAEQGYLAIFPRVENNMSYLNYKSVESAFAAYPQVKFFVGGHSVEGSGSAIRRSYENIDSVLGTILFAPVTDSARHIKVDENGNPTLDENGDEIYIRDSLSGTSLPMLVLDGKCDEIRTADANSRLSSNVQAEALDNANHTAFAQIDSVADLPILFAFNRNDVTKTTSEQKQNQRSLTATYVLAFMQSICVGK